MQKILVDSDIIIDFFRTRKGLFPHLISLQESGKIEMYISSLTVFELFVGSSSRKERTKILELVNDMKVVALDEVLAQYSGELRRDKNYRIPIVDFIIGSTALFIDALIATRNINHLKGIKGLKFW